MMPAHRVKLMNGRNINEEFYDGATKSNGPTSVMPMTQGTEVRLTGKDA